MKKDTFKWIAVFLAIIILGVAVAAGLTQGFTNANPYGWLDKKETEPEESNEETPIEVQAYSIEDIEENGLAFEFGPIFAMGGDAVSASENPYTTQTVYAYIQPSTANDKFVTWSLAWANGASLSNQNISNYITLSSNTSDNDEPIQINCYQPFRNSNITITATTRSGGKTASATITYEGIPTSLYMNGVSGSSQYNVGSQTMDMLFKGITYSCRVYQDNLFHDVGSNYNNFSASVTGVGTVVCDTYSTSPRGAYWYGNNTTKNLADFVDQYVTLSFTNDFLNIQVNKSYYEACEEITEERKEQIGLVTLYHNKVKELNRDDNGDLPYLVITVTNSMYGFSNTIKVYIGEIVASVSVAPSSITF